MSEVLLTVETTPDKTVSESRFVRIDKRTRNILGVLIGDPVKIRGRKNAVARIRLGLAKDSGKRLIRMDNYLRKSAGVKIGDKVRIRTIKLSNAKKMTIRPIGYKINVDKDFIAFVKKRALIERAFYEGNQLFVSMLGEYIPFEVIKTDPQKRPVLVTPRTILEILGKPKGEITEKPSKHPDKGLILGDKYELESLLGKGNYGEVWKARDTSLDRNVAIKLLHAGKKDFAQLKREGRALSGLKHENIVIVYDLGADEKTVG